jgi:RNA polymerase sigma factor FliA
MLRDSRENRPLPREIAAHFVPRIRKAAQRVARRLPAHICVEDLASAGFIGLVEAYRRYDATRSDCFEAYADHRIRGAMLDELRSNDPLSRDLRTHVSRTTAARRSLESRLGRVATEAEIAAHMGLSIEAFRTYSSKAAVGPAVSLDAPGRDGEPGLEVGDHAAERADDRVSDDQSKRSVRVALGALPPRLRQILELYYGDELTLRDIGGMLGVTESRVCQLHADAIQRLKADCLGQVKSDPTKGQCRPTARGQRLARRPAATSPATEASAGARQAQHS